MQLIAVETSVHGRVLYVPRAQSRLLVSFHGYGETAEASLAEIERIPGAADWSIAAVQALHPFYTRSGSIVASWMTSLDRERAAADNVAYVRRVLVALPSFDTVVFAGFSQGAAMAARAAASIKPAAALIVLGGDIPPEVKADGSIEMPPALVGRGSQDDWYTDEKFKEDLKWLEQRTEVTACRFDGGHEWTDAFRSAAGEFLQQFVRR